MDLTGLISMVRMLANDSAASNLIQRERLVDRPGNVFDGTNKIYQLNNRRICGFNLYDGSGNEISATEFTLNSGTGRLVMNSAPMDSGMFSDYFFNYLTDDEIGIAISGAAASANFDPNNVVSGTQDFCAMYSLAYVYTSIASKASYYYTISAAGKQVSKGELFNHFSQLASTTLAKALELRSDALSDRGTRAQVSDAYSTLNAAKPYLLDGGA